MGRRKIQVFDEKSDGFFSVGCLGFQSEDRCYQFGGLFASVSQMGVGVGVQPSEPSDSRDNGDTKLPFNELFIKYQGKDEVVEERVDGKKRKGGFSLRLKIKSPSLRRLFSGAIAGAVSRTAVAPLETIRTLMMVGNSDHSTTEVFHNIVKTDGWKGLFRGNFVNVIRVAPSKAIEVMYTASPASSNIYHCMMFDVLLVFLSFLYYSIDVVLYNCPVLRRGPICYFYHWFLFILITFFLVCVFDYTMDRIFSWCNGLCKKECLQDP